MVHRFKVTLSLASCKSWVPFFFKYCYGILTCWKVIQRPAYDIPCVPSAFGFALSYGETMSHVWLELLWVTIFFLPGSQQIFCYLEEILHHKNHQCEGFHTSGVRWWLYWLWGAQLFLVSLAGYMLFTQKQCSSGSGNLPCTFKVNYKEVTGKKLRNICHSSGLSWSLLSSWICQR